MFNVNSLMTEWLDNQNPLQIDLIEYFNQLTDQTTSGSGTDLNLGHLIRTYLYASLNDPKTLIGHFFTFEKALSDSMPGNIILLERIERLMPALYSELAWVQQIRIADLSIALDHARLTAQIKQHLALVQQDPTQGTRRLEQQYLHSFIAYINLNILEQHLLSINSSDEVTTIRVPPIHTQMTQAKSIIQIFLTQALSSCNHSDFYQLFYNAVACLECIPDEQRTQLTGFDKIHLALRSVDNELVHNAIFAAPILIELHEPPEIAVAQLSKIIQQLVISEPEACLATLQYAPHILTKAIHVIYMKNKRQAEVLVSLINSCLAPPAPAQLPYELIHFLFAVYRFNINCAMVQTNLEPESIATCLVSENISLMASRNEDILDSNETSLATTAIYILSQGKLYYAYAGHLSEEIPIPPEHQVELQSLFQLPINMLKYATQNTLQRIEKLTHHHREITGIDSLLKEHFLNPRLLILERDWHKWFEAIFIKDDFLLAFPFALATLKVEDFKSTSRQQLFARFTENNYPKSVIYGLLSILQHQEYYPAILQDRLASLCELYDLSLFQNATNLQLYCELLEGFLDKRVRYGAPGPRQNLAMGARYFQLAEDYSARWLTILTQAGNPDFPAFAPNMFTMLESMRDVSESKIRFLMQLLVMNGFLEDFFTDFLKQTQIKMNPHEVAQFNYEQIEKALIKNKRAQFPTLNVNIDKKGAEWTSKILLAILVLVSRDLKNPRSLPHQALWQNLIHTIIAQLVTIDKDCYFGRDLRQQIKTSNVCSLLPVAQQERFRQTLVPECVKKNYQLKQILSLLNQEAKNPIKNKKKANKSLNSSVDDREDFIAVTSITPEPTASTSTSIDPAIVTETIPPHRSLDNYWPLAPQDASAFLEQPINPFMSDASSTALPDKPLEKHTQKRLRKMSRLISSLEQNDTLSTCWLALINIVKRNVLELSDSGVQMDITPEQPTHQLTSSKAFSLHHSESQWNQILSELNWIVQLGITTSPEHEIEHRTLLSRTMTSMSACYFKDPEQIIEPNLLTFLFKIEKVLENRGINLLIKGSYFVDPHTASDLDLLCLPAKSDLTLKDISDTVRTLEKALNLHVSGVQIIKETETYQCSIEYVLQSGKSINIEFNLLSQFMDLPQLLEYTKRAIVSSGAILFKLDGSAIMISSTAQAIFCKNPVLKLLVCPAENTYNLIDKIGYILKQRIKHPNWRCDDALQQILTDHIDPNSRTSSEHTSNLIKHAVHYLLAPTRFSKRTKATIRFIIEHDLLPVAFPWLAIDAHFFKRCSQNFIKYYARLMDQTPSHEIQNYIFLATYFSCGLISCSDSARDALINLLTKHEANIKEALKQELIHPDSVPTLGTNKIIRILSVLPTNVDEFNWRAPEFIDYKLPPQHQFDPNLAMILIFQFWHDPDIEEKINLMTRGTGVVLNQHAQSTQNIQTTRSCSPSVARAAVRLGFYQAAIATEAEPVLAVHTPPNL